MEVEIWVNGFVVTPVGQFEPVISFLFVEVPGQHPKVLEAHLAAVVLFGNINLVVVVLPFLEADWELPWGG